MKRILMIALLAMGMLWITGMAEASTEAPFPYVTCNYDAGETEALRLVDPANPNACVLGMGQISGYIGGRGNLSYNLDGRCSRFSFKAAYHSGVQQGATLTVAADGQTLRENVRLEWNAPVPYSFDFNVTGVKQLTIDIYIPDTHSHTCYAFSDIRAVSNAPEKPRKVSDEFYDVVRSASKQLALINGDFEMGGFRYTDGYDVWLGSNWNSETINIKLAFNGQYRKLSFDVGWRPDNLDSNYLRSAYVTLIADGETLPDYNGRQIKWNDLSLHVEADLEGVNELTVRLNSGGWEIRHLHIGDIQLVSDGRAHGVLLASNSVKLTPSTPRYDLNPRVYPSDAADKRFTVSSSAPKVVAAKKDGRLCAARKGTAEVTVTTLDGNHAAVCAVTTSANNFLPSVDGWGFDNQRIDNCLEPVYLPVYERVFGWQHRLRNTYSFQIAPTNFAFDALDAWDWIVYFYGGVLSEPGICDGMSMAAALTYTEAMPFSTWSWSKTSPGTPGDVRTYDKSDGYSTQMNLNLVQFIYACQLYSTSSLNAMTQKLTNWNDYSRLFDETRNFQKTGKNPLTLGLHFDNGKRKCAHAVVPYCLEERDNEVRVYVYDPNSPHYEETQDTDDVYISFSVDDEGRVVDWSFTREGKYEYRKANTTLCIVNSFSEIANRIKMEQYFQTPKNFFTTNMNRVLFYRSGKWLGECSGGSWSMREGETVALPVSGGMCPAIGLTGDVSIMLGGSGRAVSACYGEDFGCIVETPGDALLTTRSDSRGLRIESSDAQIKVQYNQGNNITVATGTVPGDLTTAIDAEGMPTFTGFSDIQITTLVDGVVYLGERQEVDPACTCTATANAGIVIHVPEISEVLTLPDWLNHIEDEAFENIAVRMVICPEGLLSIGSRAFANCAGLEGIVIMADTADIADDAFDGCEGLTIYCAAGSAAEQYAQAHGIPVARPAA